MNLFGSSWNVDPNIVILISLGLALLATVLRYALSHWNALWSSLPRPNPEKPFVFSPADHMTWTGWAAPLTGAGGVLAAVLLVHGGTNTLLFADLSLFFGALILVAPLAMTSKGNWVSIGIAQSLTAWGVFGELATTMALVGVVSNESESVAFWLRVVLLMGMLLALYYALGYSTAPAQAVGAGEEAASSQAGRTGSHGKGQVS